MKNILLGVLGLLALSLVPVSGHAQMPGDKCGGDDHVQVGTTRMATDRQNIIACLETGDTTPGANVSEWKAMTSGGPQFGGIFFTNYNDGCDGNPDGTPINCRYPNPITKNCSCPYGFETKRFFDFNKCTNSSYWNRGAGNLAGPDGLYPNGVSGAYMYYCIRR